MPRKRVKATEPDSSFFEVADWFLGDETEKGGYEADDETYAWQKDEIAFQIHDAIRDENLEKASELLNDGANVDAIFDGATPLYHAALYGNPEIMRFLLEKGADIHFQDKESGFTALHIAVSFVNDDQTDQNSEQNLGQNLGQNPQLDESDLKGERVQIIAEMVNLLLEYRADINAQDVMGNTVLHEAIETEASAEIIELLLEKGADANLENHEGVSAYKLAEKKQNPELFDVFSKYCFSEKFDDSEESQLARPSVDSTDSDIKISASKVLPKINQERQK